MRTEDWETAPQTVLRNCSKEAVGKIDMQDFGLGLWHTTLNTADLICAWFLR